MKYFFTIFIVLMGLNSLVFAQGALPFQGFVDAPVMKLKPASTYPRTEKMWAYTLWDSIQVNISRTGQQLWGDYRYLWRTETGICAIGENEYATDTSKTSEGCYFYTADSTVYFYNKALKKYYHDLLHLTNSPVPYLIPPAFFQDINTFNTRHLEIGCLDKVQPIHIWTRMHGKIDTIHIVKGNVDDDPESEQLIDIRFQMVDGRGYKIHRILFLDKGKNGKWYAQGAIEVPCVTNVAFDKKNQSIVIKSKEDRSGTGQIYTEEYTDIYRWVPQDSTLAERVRYTQDRIHDYEFFSNYIFDRTEQTTHTFKDFNTLVVLDSMAITGTTRKHEVRLDTSTYTWLPEVRKFQETNSTRWSRAANYTWLDTTQFYIYTRWDSLPAIVVRKFGYEPASRNVRFGRVLQQAWYNVDGKDYPFEKNQCAVLIRKARCKYDDIYAYSCELRDHLEKLSEPVNSDSPIPISDSMIYYINISKNIDTLDFLSPVKHFSSLIASVDLPEKDEVKKMEMWNVNIDNDPYKETIWWIWDSQRTNGLLLIIDQLGGSPHIVSIEDVSFFNKLPKPVIDIKNKLITVRCPRGKYETYKYFRYENNRLEQVFEVQGAIEIGGLRQELDAMPHVIDENTIEVNYMYNLFFEQAYPETEAMRLGFLNNISAKATFAYDGTKFVCSKMTDDMPLLTKTDANSVMTAFLQHNRATLENEKTAGEASQKQILRDYLQKYLNHFGL
jgi:hypothetical protein